MRKQRYRPIGLTSLTFCSLFDIEGPGTRFLLTDAGLAEVDDPEEADVIVFNGGEDIATEIYGETPVFGGIPRKMSRRDIDEINIFDGFAGRRLLLGICRGSQLLNCLNGGTLWQHVNNHSRDHNIIDVRTGKIYRATSTHHQMMRPNLDVGELIAVASLSTMKHDDKSSVPFTPTTNLKDGEDVEIVWYPANTSLCIQGHPEYVPGTKYADYCLQLIDECYQQVNKGACAA